MTHLRGISGSASNGLMLPAMFGLLALLAFPSDAPGASAGRGAPGPGDQTAPQQEQQQEWTKVDCAGSDAHLTPPSGVRADCYVGPFKQSMGQVYACRLSNYSFGVPTEGTEPRFYARATFPKKEGKNCAVILEKTPTDVMQHVHKFVDAQATNWSPMQTVGGDIQLMLFDAKNQKREGKCASFIKLGPAAGKQGYGHLFVMMGFLCKAPGQPLDAGAAAALVNGIRINVED